MVSGLCGEVKANQTEKVETAAKAKPAKAGSRHLGSK
jgi:hypothetical protein